MNRTISLTKTAVSLKTQTIATVLAIIAAVALPQLLHTLGATLGLGTALGEIFLPMHLPIILTGLLAGPFAGAISGILGPVVSFYISGMPIASALPFMMAELFAYGLCAGMLRTRNMPVTVKVIISQIAGRVMRAAAILVAIYMFGNNQIGVFSVVSAIRAGAVGIILQIVLIPTIIHIAGKINEN